MIRRREFLTAASVPLFFGKELHADRPKSSCILLLMVGGPSQIDTWDPKPNAPSGIRSRYASMRTSVPGIGVTEIFPRMARQMDKITLVRSVYHDGPALHDAGHQWLQTGSYSPLEGTAAHIGSVVGNHVLLPHSLGNTGSGDIANGQNGLQATALDFAALQTEPAKLRDRYGRNRFGQSCLLARQLVESGTRFVTVNMFETVFGQPTWDAHGSEPFSSLRAHGDHAAPIFDAAYSTLLEDLASRGLLDATLVVAAGEFGRTPRINPCGGRDHWPQCWTIAMAGGPALRGAVYGSSDSTASEPKERPVHVSRIAATMAAHVGVKTQAVHPLTFS